MPNISKKAKEKNLKSFGEHHTFLSRITKSLYYGKLPKHDRLSLPVTELATELFSEAHRGRSLDRLHCNDAASISRSACVSPCSFILAMLYLERLKACNPEYIQRISPTELFLVSLMVSSKFLYDDGEEDEVFIDEWAMSGNMSIKELEQLEKEFLNAINWNIYVNEITFWKKLCELERKLATREGTGRGWFTYTELLTLLPTLDASMLCQYLTLLSTVLMATYITGLLTVVGSIFIVNRFHENYLLPLESTKPVTIGNDSIITSDVNLITNDINLSSEFLSSSHHLKTYIDPVNVLKASLILASIKTGPDSSMVCNNSCCDTIDLNDHDENKEYVTWDWWSSTAMNWLSEISRAIENFVLYSYNGKYDYYTDITIANLRVIDLQDQLHKGTKIRIQDQLEHTWHKEWTDMIHDRLFNSKFFDYLQRIKV